MKFNINYISEREIDLLIIEEFANNPTFASVFLEPLNIKIYIIESIDHSVTDIVHGESDIRVILNSNNHRIALLIEDKINAIAMPQQSSRYQQRGLKGIQEGFYDEFHVFLVAPQKYYDGNEEAQKYPYFISYEQLLSVFSDNHDGRSLFKAHLIESAIERAKTPYQVIKDDAVTKFWNSYLDEVIQHFPDLNINQKKSDRGSKSHWPTFHTFDKRVKIRHKADRGYIDLEFSGTAKAIQEIETYLRTIELIENQYIGNAGKSSVVRYHVPTLNFKNDFDIQQELVHQCLENVRKAYILFNRIDLTKVFRD
jgi:hypothetical protein